MGSIISKIEDLYDDYRILCERYHVTPENVFDSAWVKQLYELEEKDRECINQLKLEL